MNDYLYSDFAAQNLEHDAWEMQSSQGNPNQWMLTMADLFSLITAFFVMLFAMNSANMARFEELSRSLNMRLQPDFRHVPSLLLTPLSAKPIMLKKASELDYLEQVIHTKLAAHSELKNIVITRQDDRLALTLPFSQLFKGQTLSLQSKETAILEAIIDIMGELQNTIEVVGVGLDSNNKEPALLWKSALARAMAVTSYLKAKGYNHSISALGHVENSALAPLSLEDNSNANRAKGIELEGRIDIIIHDKQANSPNDPLVE